LDGIGAVLRALNGIKNTISIFREIDMKPALIEALEKLVAWVRCDLLPLWRNQEVAAEGWIASRLDSRGAPDGSCPIMLASQAELAYVFACAEQLGWCHGSRAQVRKLIEFAGRHGTLPCRSDGYVHSVDRQFAILDERHYLIDHALFMLASMTAYRAYGDGADARRAYNIFDWLEVRLTHPSGGWFEDSDLRPQRWARSHFYMLQSFLNLYEVTRKPRWLDLAQVLVTLYQQKLLGEHKLLFRDYRQDWVSVAADTWYPEDQFLWVYGVHKYARCSGQKLSAADLYHRVCESKAFGAGGLCLEAVGSSSTGVFATGALAAALLAGVSLAAEGDQRAADRLENQIRVFFHTCIASGPAGLFIDRKNPMGTPETFTSATTSLILFDAARYAAKWLSQSAI
jgi:hypothetical protein